MSRDNSLKELKTLETMLTNVNCGAIDECPHRMGRTAESVVSFWLLANWNDRLTERV